MNFNDLLGDPDDLDILEKPARPLKSPKGSDLKVQDVHKVLSGVSITWLAQVFRIPRYKVVAALTDCPVLRTTQNGSKIYDVRTAAAYLVEPTTDLDAFLHTIKANQLPEKLRETYWNAKIKEAKYKVMAGELWPTESVIEVLGETFKTLKKTTQLWADTIDEAEELTSAQRTVLSTLVKRLQEDLHQSLVEQAESSETANWLGQQEDL